MDETNIGQEICFLNFCKVNMDDLVVKNKLDGAFASNSVFAFIPCCSMFI